ncbi:MAG TPA: hypothetical protein VNA20_10225 [Frankiaceae bacterium]|nr:hypothetical protein [Frankiaceae bacterium]
MAAAGCFVAAFAGVRLDTTLLALAALNAPAWWALAGWALAVAAAVLFRPRRRVAVALVVVGVPLAGFSLFAMSLGSPPASRLLATTPGPGSYELRLVESSVFVDPWWEVRVRSRRGLLSREACVFVVTPPRRVRTFEFAGANGVAVTDSDGVRHVVRFDPESLRPDRSC